MYSEPIEDTSIIKGDSHRLGHWSATQQAPETRKTQNKTTSKNEYGSGTWSRERRNE